MGENNMDLREIHIIGKRTREFIVGPNLCRALGWYGIGLTGLTEATPDFRFVRLSPKVTQLLVCISGTGQVWMANEWLRCSTGMAYLTPPGAVHGYHAVAGEPWRLCWVIYAEGREEQALPPGIERPVLLETDPQPLAATIHGLYREAMGAAELEVMHSWTRLLHTYARRVMMPTSPLEARLRPLWEAVDMDLTFPWTVETLAHRADLSGEHLRRLCQQTLGRSPMRQVTFLRMRRAAALLASASYTVEAVAQQVGYANTFAFSTAFKRQQGVSPSEFRMRSHGEAPNGNGERELPVYTPVSVVGSHK